MENPTYRGVCEKLRIKIGFNDVIDIPDPYLLKEGRVQDLRR